jgi:hypothetical protein
MTTYALIGTIHHYGENKIVLAVSSVRNELRSTLQLIIDKKIDVEINFGLDDVEPYTSCDEYDIIKLFAIEYLNSNAEKGNKCILRSTNNFEVRLRDEIGS